MRVFLSFVFICVLVPVLMAQTADPNYRGYTDGAALLFMNAIFRSSGHTGAPISEQE